MPVLLQNRQRAIAVNQAWLGRIAEAVLAAAGAGASELSLALVSAQRMRALNRRYRNKDRTTDVLAFPMDWKRGQASRFPSFVRRGRGGRTSPALPHPSSPYKGEGDFPKLPALLGDVVISMPTATRQAEALGHSLRDELTRLLTHGVLHLLGYDHERGDRDAAIMARKEKSMLRAIRGSHPHPPPSRGRVGGPWPGRR